MARVELDVSVLSGGNFYPLNNVDGWILDTYEGLGITEIQRLTQSAPFQKGSSDDGYDQNDRYIPLTWINQGLNNICYWEIRRDMMAIFRPRVDDPITMYFTFPDGRRLASIVNLEGALDYRANDRMDGRTGRVSFVLRAGDPRLFVPTRNNVSFFLITDASGWEIADAAPNAGWQIANTAGAAGWPIGLSAASTLYDLYYADGDMDADIEWPILRLHGPISSPTITNLTNDESLPFTANGGLNLGIGQFIEIDLSFNRKTVFDQDDNAADQYLDSDNDLLTWHLSYNTELLTSGSRSNGHNTIQVSGSNVGATTRLEIFYYDRYAGA